MYPNLFQIGPFTVYSYGFMVALGTIIAAFLAGGSGILVHNFFSVNMRFIICAVYFYFVMGLMFSLGKETKT